MSGEYHDTAYPCFTFRSWPFDLEDSDPLFKLPDPATTGYHEVTFLDHPPWQEDAKPDDPVPLVRLFRVCKVLVGPGYTNTGEALIHGQAPAHIHLLYGWSDDPLQNNRVMKVGPEYLKEEYRRGA